MLITNQPHTIFPTLARTQWIADRNNAAPAGDTRRRLTRTGRAIVKVYDEDGVFIANL
jgi:hypothetical protein